MTRVLSAALIALAVVFTAGYGQELDSFKVYRVKAMDAAKTVSLRGQFDDQPIPSNLGQLVSFSTPVGIDGEAIKDPRCHLTWYSLENPTEEPRRVVEVVNRFGQMRLTLGQPVFLLVPAEKKTPSSAAPTNLDHFKVYEVAQAKCVNRANRFVDLNDQSGDDENVEVRFPRYLAVPVEKTVDSGRFPIQNAQAHLTIYEIRAKQDSFGTFRVIDQFGDRALTLERSELLCVPSLKQEITVPEGLDHLQIYDVTDLPVNEKIRVRDLFDRTTVSTQLHKIIAFATVARRNQGDLANQDASFTLYRIDQLKADPIRMVQVWNQLGEQQLWIGAARKLLVPAKLKKGNTFADDLDYYVCYSVVRPGSFVPTTATFEDSLGQTKQVSAITPMLFCVPADGGQGGINDMDNHLIIYRIDPRGESDSGEIDVEDPFGEHTLDPKANTMLGVPTLKFDVFPPPQQRDE